MAEAILSDLAKKILEGFGSLLVQEIGLASGVRKELRKLEESLSQIKAILSDAEKKGAMNDVVKDWLRKLKDVAYDAEDVLDEFATEVLRQKVELPNNNMAVKQVRRCFSRSNPLVFRLKMAHRIKDIIERLDRIKKDNLYPTFQSLPDENVDRDIYGEDRRHTYPYVIESGVLGRDQDRENLVALLLSSGGGSNTREDENVMVIPIIGIGGLGKTTLAQYVYNDERVEKHFESRVWVCVSFDFDVVKLAKKIFNSLTNGKFENLGENVARSELKRYLLVLDDVWNDHPGKWENLRTHLMVRAMKGSMILVTTRTQEVASIMHPIKEFYPLKGLDENDCESLFNVRAFGRKGKEANHPELVKIGKGIVKKCGGVPLAAKALGSLLRLQRNKNDWLCVLKTEIWNLPGEKEILPALRISYNQLPSHLKQCFAYCSLFQQDHEINVDDLIHQWMAHGFISPSSSSSSSPSSGGSHNKSLEDIGNRYFRELLWRSFFQEVEEDEYGNIRVCKMHDLVHNLARWVAGLEWSEVVLGPSPSSRASCSSGVRHMVQVYHGIYDTHLLPLEKPQKLRTLYLQCTFRCNPSTLATISGLVSNLRGLHVLNLSGLGMVHVPSSIGYLKQLRYLDLSRNDFQALPNSICRLYNLQTLILEYCPRFFEWPRDMTKMVGLRHLGLCKNNLVEYLARGILGQRRLGYHGLDANNHLEYMPRGLGKLTSLRTLRIFVVDDPNNTRRRGRISGGLGELHGLNQLRDSLRIEGLGNVRDARDAEEAKLKDKSELQNLEFRFFVKVDTELRGRVEMLRVLGNQGILEDEQVLGNLEPHPSLKGLTIAGYQGVKMPRWMIIPSSSLLLSNLVVLKIEQCSNLKCLPLIGEFPCLRTLFLCNLNALDLICNKVGVGGGEALPLFPSLKDLTLTVLPNLKRWTINPSSSVEATTTMTTVEEEEEEEEEAQHNNNQFHFLSSMFPRLADLFLYDCPKLTRVPLLSVAGIQHLTSLRTLIIHGHERLVSLPDCPAPATLQLLEIKDCPRLVRLPDRFFENLKLLSEFEISNCSVQLTSLPERIQHLAALKKLRIKSCGGLKALPEGLGSLSSLEELYIKDCSNLSSLPEGIQHLTALKELTIKSCPGLKALPEGLASFSSLEQLYIKDCSNLSSLPEGIQHLTVLKELTIKSCPGLKALPEGLGSFSSLEQLYIKDCSNLSSLPEGIQHLTALKELTIKSCPGLKALPEGLGSLSSLEELYIKDCSNLSSLPEGIQHLTALEYMSINNCPGLRALPDGLGNLASRGELQISNCPNLSLPRNLQLLLN